MLYNDVISYDQAGVSYSGTIILLIQGILNPIILNDIKINFSVNPDYSVGSTIGVISIDINPVGVITIETLADQGSALIEAKEITIHSGTLVSIQHQGQ